MVIGSALFVDSLTKYTYESSPCLRNRGTWALYVDDMVDSTTLCLTRCLLEKKISVYVLLYLFNHG